MPQHIRRGLRLYAMQTDRYNRYWALLVVLLVAVIIASGIVAWSKYRPGHPVEIFLTPPRATPGMVNVDGAVNNPGIYPLRDDDSLFALIQAAGGTTGDADMNRVELRIPRQGEREPVQKININRADVWLLSALPGIGETRARAIVEYRRQRGPFRSINELTRVEGIGDTTYQRIKDLITVAD